MDLHPRVESELQRIRADGVLAVSESGLAGLHQRVVEAGGKMLRPRLVLMGVALGASAGKAADWELGRRAALAIEIAHVGTLYHDDLVDRSPSRRGAQAVHLRAGTRGAVIGGAHLLALANSIAAGLPDSMAAAWGRAALRVADGQLRETENAGNLEVSIDEYLRIARKKTASLFELAAGCGAQAGAGVDSVDAEPLIQFGRHYGTAFQLVDDLNDFVRPSTNHRVEATDLRARIYTLPVLLVSRGGSADAKTLRGLLRDDGRPVADEAVAEVVELLRDAGGFADAGRYAMAEREAALRCLSAIPQGPENRELQRMVEALAPPASLVDEESGASH